MAASTTIVDRGAFGDLFTRVVDVALDNDYPAGGYTIPPVELGFGENGSVVALFSTPSFTDADLSSVYVTAVYDSVNQLLIILDGDTEAPNNTDLSDATVRVLALGIGQG